MRKILLTSLIICCHLDVFAQLPPITELGKLPVFDLPFEANKGDVLVSVSADGKIMDVLEAIVMWFPGTAVKQYKVTGQGTVIVYHLHTSSSKSGLNFYSFTGYRTDTEYKIDNSGKFQKISEMRYKEKVYYYTDLQLKSNNIWQGDEIPLN